MLCRDVDNESVLVCKVREYAMYIECDCGNCCKKRGRAYGGALISNVLKSKGGDGEKQCEWVSERVNVWKDGVKEGMGLGGGGK